MATTLLRGMTGASSRTSASRCCSSCGLTPTYIGSPASATTTAVVGGLAELVEVAGHDAEQGVLAVVNLAIRTARAYRRRRAAPSIVQVWRRRPGGRARRTAPRVDAVVAPHLARRRDGAKHPVHDFLFTYYSFSPAQLLAWAAGLAARAGRREQLGAAAPAGHAAIRGAPAAPTASAAGAHRLLRAARVGDGAPHRRDPPRRGRSVSARPAPTRSSSRTGSPARTSTPSASSRRRPRPLNALQPGRDDRAAYEQPACLHAKMDLYKHAFRLCAAGASDLVADCFELARDIRVVDMRASPYDFADLGFAPIRDRDAQGKQEYAAPARLRRPGRSPAQSAGRGVRRLAVRHA